MDAAGSRRDAGADASVAVDAAKDTGIVDARYDGDSPLRDECGAPDAGPAPGDCPVITPTGGTCTAVTPATTGASACGENAAVPSWALAPSANPNGKLLLFYNGSGGHPAEEVPATEPNRSFYQAALSLGYHVLAISYPSNESIGDYCVCDDSCFFPSRESIILGRYYGGAAAPMKPIALDEGAVDRVVLALQWLEAQDASAGWGEFLNGTTSPSEPETMIAWNKVVTAGHSQGGGHATATAKLFPVARSIELSSTCDVVVPAADCAKTTAAALPVSVATPASWTSRSNGTWATPASAFYGLDSKAVFPEGTYGSWMTGDKQCFIHTQAWANLQMPESQQNDAEETCGATSVVEFHVASITCSANFPSWTSMLE